MITWIQLRTQKHIKLIFAFLLVVMVVPFVFTIGNQSFFGSHDDSHYKTKDFYGYNLASQNTTAYLEQTARMSAMFSREQMAGPNHMYDTERYSKERAAALTMAKTFGIAEPTEEQLRAYIRTKAMFQDDKGQFSATNYKTMIEFFKDRQGIPEATILKVLSEDYCIEKVRKLLGGAGFINPEIIALERQNLDTAWTVSVAKLPLASFKPAINPTEAQLKNFYEVNKARFEIKERIRLTQIRFPAVSYAGKVPMPTEEQVKSFFANNKANYVTKAGVEPTLDAATRNSVVQDFIQASAVQLAAQKADEYTLALWRESLTYKSPQVFKMAQDMGAQVSPVEPFANGKPPRNADVESDQLNGMWTLANSERYFSDVVSGNNGASVFVFQGTIPSRMPSFAEVRNTVSDEYVTEQRNLQFVAYGKDLQKKIQADLNAGKSFENVAKSYGLTTENFANVKVGTADRSLLRDGGPLDIAARLRVGGVSAMQIDEKGGSLVYLQNKVVPPADNVRGKPEEIAVIRERFATIDGWEVLGALCDKRIAELEADLNARNKAGK
jgi:peptidyl-prolyl cis-trans isomerase D